MATSAHSGSLKYAFLAIITSVLIFCAPVRAAEVAQINLILDEGVVLIYKGADYGFKTGDALDVMRAGQLIGRLEITEVFPTFTRAKIISQEKTIEVFDVVAKSSAPAPSTMKKPSTEEKAATEKKPAEKKAATEKKPAEKKPAAKKDEKKAAAEKKPVEKKEEKKPAEKKEEKKPEVAASPMPRTYTNIMLGYFFLNQDIDIANQTEQKGVISYGVDYWMRGKPGKKRTASTMVGISMAKPTIKITTPTTPASISTKFISLHANYIIDDVAQQKGSSGSFYYGAGVAYRKLKFNDVNFAGSTIGLDEDSDTGYDFNVILGYRFDNKSEVKAQYSVDEHYYSISYGYGLR